MPRFLKAMELFLVKGLLILHTSLTKNHSSNQKKSIILAKYIYIYIYP